MIIGSASFIGIGMMAAVLPLMYVERGAQMTFVLQSLLLLVSGVYYSIEVLPRLDAGPVAVLARHVRPGWRPRRASSRAHPSPSCGTTSGRCDHGGRVHPARHLGLRHRGTLCQANRQAQEGRLMDDHVHAGPRGRSGWTPDRETGVPRARPAGLIPARGVGAAAAMRSGRGPSTGDDRGHRPARLPPPSRWRARVPRGR